MKDIEYAPVTAEKTGVAGHAPGPNTPRSPLLLIVESIYEVNTKVVEQTATWDFLQFWVVLVLDSYQMKIPKIP